MSGTKNRRQTETVMAKKGKSGNPAGRPKGTKRKYMTTKDGHAELVRRGFNPVAELVKLYGEVSEDLNNSKFNSSVWNSNIRSTQRSILEALLRET
jgi:hypothetical protein